MKISLEITRRVEVKNSPRVMQMSGLFDVAPAERSVQSWKHDLELPDEWNIGVVVGPSGAGKTTFAREVFGAKLVEKWDWPADQSILDGFPQGMGIKDITGLLSSVGFSSPPSWVRPFHVLSNGEQFRVNVARTIAECPDLAAVDEFTSVVDRTVARIGSAAIAKAVRRRGQRFVAITCHYDVLDWLEPDWVYEPHTGRLATRESGADASRGAVRLDGNGNYRRPTIELEIVRADRSAWELFKSHHYLSAELSPSAACYVALLADRPVAFAAVMSFPHPVKPSWREHRMVCLPDFQGVGIGNAMSEFVAGLYRGTGKRYTSTTGHPAMIRHRAGSPLWRMIRKPGFAGRGGRGGQLMRKTSAHDRLTAGFEYVGPGRVEEAMGFGLKCGGGAERDVGH